jgi:hypothetical protein
VIVKAHHKIFIAQYTGTSLVAHGILVLHSANIGLYFETWSTVKSLFSRGCRDRENKTRKYENI